ncbi:hypothetical protein M9H77_25170 [Catharanthus roseus]|uniref:Uncharacterized protein n=1 Tax=Catharanthus roseus TaxID=4058 RepID=A0ACC0A7F0_CATRO|nr:hypothetical protein M9H77_25170 [Catharanthus roseus]
MADENPDEQIPPESEPDEALRLKSLAEKKYVDGNLKSAIKYAKRASHLHPSLDGVLEMLTAFRIIRTANKTLGLTPVDGTLLPTSISAPAPPDYYSILQVERFANINTIKKEYKKLALILHPDKNSFVASEEAFKHVGEAFRVLSDRIRRKEYDMRLRISMQSEAEAAAGVGSEVGVLETFWTSCSKCRLLHKFERKYVEHILVCPNCKKGFKAVEVDDEKDEEHEKVDQGEKLATRVSERIRARKGGKMSSVVEILKRSVGNGKGLRDVSENKGSRIKSEKKDARDGHASGRLGGGSDDGVIDDLRSRSRRNEETSGGEEVMTRTGAKRMKVDEEDMMTLAQMQLLVKKKVSEERMKLRGKDKGKETEKEKEKNMEVIREKDREMGKGEETENDKFKEKEMEKDKESENQKDKEMEDKKDMKMENINEREKRQRRPVIRTDYVQILGRRASKVNKDIRLDKPKKSKRDKLDIVEVEELEFYDFDKDRSEKRFKTGQVWATYDSENGLPRHYALIDEVVSVNPFEVRLSWLEFQSNGDERLINWEEMGFHVSCGRFKVSENSSAKSVKMFSHIAAFERAARELYWIYPKKGSVWAVYNENVSNLEGREVKDRYCYDIVVILTSYSDKYGISMAYLEKVNGFKAVFKRREVGVDAVRWLEKVDFRLFSHQIPSKKLSGKEAASLPKDCWVLDPPSLPPEPLTIGWGR